MSHQQEKKRKIAIAAAFVTLCLVWSSTWLVIKVGYGGLGPFNVAALRFFIAGTVMAVAAQATRAARLAVANDVIRNDGDLAALRDQVAGLHRRYVEAARSRNKQ
jgi:drug/metabolite transporter (DMT)-like permease